MDSLTPIPSPGWLIRRQLRQQLLPWMVVLVALVVAAVLWQKCLGIVDPEIPGSGMVHVENGAAVATRLDGVNLGEQGW